MFGIGWRQTVSEAEAKRVYEDARKRMGNADREELVRIHRSLRKAHRGAFDPNGGPVSGLQCQMSYLMSSVRSAIRNFG